MTRSELQSLIQDWIEAKETQPLLKDIVSIIQFGSTTKEYIKQTTDVDLLVLFRTIPEGSLERHSILTPIEDSLNFQLNKMKDHQLHTSIIAKDVRNLQNVLPIYLDMVEDHHIFLDLEGHGQMILDKTKRWMLRHGSKKIQKGLLWYWILDTISPPGSDVDFNFDK
jgi:predicted nucleotidyltransferase